VKIVKSTDKERVCSCGKEYSFDGVKYGKIFDCSCGEKVLLIVIHK